MICGAGNDRPTPWMILDILRHDPSVEAEPLSFESVGEGKIASSRRLIDPIGMKQHNMGKVYSGLYHTNGHVVPYIVVIKVGKPSEVVKPGNRGKRDSQVMLMRFLNRIHFNKPLNSLELDLYHHIRNLIGIMPTFYEYILMVDSDTHVKPDAASRLISAFVNDSLVIGACGETSLANGKSSITTMIQVYEYWISHNLSKAFESLFGSVTCLPGCFSMYRIYSSDSGKPLFCSDKILDAYSEPRADFFA